MRMKLLLAGLASLVLSGIVWGQTTATPEQVIRRMIESGAIEGRDQKIIGNLGDAAAVTVTKVVADKNLRSGEMDMVLIVLRRSFSDPNTIETSTDRQPRTTLFVLRYLECLTSDPELKAKIANAREYVLKQVSKLNTN